MNRKKHRNFDHTEQLENIERVSGKRSLVQQTDPSKTTRWGKLNITDRYQVITNNFGPVSQVWLYTLLQRVQTNTEWKTNSWLWRLILFTSSTFIQCSQNYPTAHLLAAELLDLVIGFNLLQNNDDSHEEEFVLAILGTLSTCLPLILERTVPRLLFDMVIPFLENIRTRHSHEKCRQFARTILTFLSPWTL